MEERDISSPDGEIFFLNFRPTIVQPLQSCCMLVAKDIYPYSRLTIFRSNLFFDEINY